MPHPSTTVTDKNGESAYQVFTAALTILFLLLALAAVAVGVTTTYIHTGAAVAAVFFGLACVAAAD